jgi:hypothetical protein
MPDSLNILCPLCGHEHTYLVEVATSPVLTLTADRDEAKAVTKTFTRLFTCANGHGTFQAPIEIQQEAGEEIKDVEVSLETGET